MKKGWLFTILPILVCVAASAGIGVLLSSSVDTDKEYATEILHSDTTVSFDSNDPYADITLTFGVDPNGVFSVETENCTLSEGAAIFFDRYVRWVVDRYIEEHCTKSK